MKTQRVFLENGREVTTEDLAVIGEQGGSIMDQAISELFRLAPRTGAAAKGVIPFAIGPGSSDPRTTGIVTSTGSADGALYVYPFRAYVGAIAVADSPELAWTRTRSVAVVPPSGTVLQNAIALTATDGTHSRCDLIYCKVTIVGSQTSQVRYVRDPSTGVVSSPTVVTEISDTYTLGVTTGTQFVGTTPARPATPADTSTEYYIPLAYVFLPIGFTTGTTILNKWIQEIAPVLPISRATCAVSVRPASWHNKSSLDLLAGTGGDDFNTAAGGHRGIVYAPSTWVGGEELVIFASWNTTGPANYPALNTTHVVDDSTDWRRRMFRWSATSSTAASSLPWDGGGPRAGNAEESGFGQSFADDGTGAFGVAGGVVALNLGATILTNVIQLYVDLATGSLKMKTPAASPNKDLFIWLRATGQYANSS